MIKLWVQQPTVWEGLFAEEVAELWEPRMRVVDEPVPKSSTTSVCGGRSTIRSLATARRKPRRNRFRWMGSWRTLIQWYRQTAYAASDDWVFASPTKGGKQPYWPENLRRHVQRVAAAQGIRKKVGWHTFRRTLSTLLVNNGDDVKTVELLRYASARITLEIYAQALGGTKREAQGQAYRMLQDGVRKTALHNNL